MGHPEQSDLEIFCQLKACRYAKVNVFQTLGCSLSLGPFPPRAALLRSEEEVIGRDEALTSAQPTRIPTPGDSVCI